MLEGLGFKTGLSNPCTFYHPDRHIEIVVHGGDFTALAVDSQLDWYESSLKKSFEIKIRGRLGEGCTGAQEIRILNRIVKVDSEGLTYEADPRHSDLLLASLSMTECTGAATPGVKPLDRDEHAIKTDEPQTPTLDPDPNKAIASICSMEDEPAAQQYVDSLKDTTAYDLYQDGGACGKSGVRDNANVNVTANATGPLKYNPILK